MKWVPWPLAAMLCKGKIAIYMAASGHGTPGGSLTAARRIGHNSLMAQAAPPPSVKLICGMISADAELFARAEARLAALLGPIDLAGEVMPFDLTHYYDEEMGSPLLRKFVAFERLVSPEVLIEAKCLTNDLEVELAAGAAVPRPINLDPGYIEHSKLVLASMKNFSHRLYLGRGVYGEVTLMYRKGAWEPLAWTFPDYASGRYDAFLTAARQRLSSSSGPRQQEPS